MIILLLLIILVVLFIYIYFKNSFWYNFDYYLKEKKFYVNPKYKSNYLFHSGVLTVEFKKFYDKYYFKNINLNFQVFNNFDLIYFYDNDLKGIILNTIIPIKIYNKKYTTTFVDYGVVKKEDRGGNIFRFLMNETSRNANKWGTDFINFKIDNKPLKSGLNYLQSEYLLIDEIKQINKFIIKDFEGIIVDMDNYIKIENEGVKVSGLEQKNHFEIKYIFFKDNNIKFLEEVLKMLLIKYKIIGFDNIGNNIILSKTFKTRLSHQTYHYMLGYNKLKKENFYI